MDNNLTTNLQTIKTAFEDIKSALNSKGANIIDCTPVTEYAQAINDLPSDVFSGTFIVFKQSETTPDIPEGGSWNGSSFEYPYGWGPTQKSRLVGPVWMSYAIITQDTSDSIIWSTPVKISGEAGDSSQIGVVTIDGILYWTLNGELIYDENGNPVKAEGVDGKNANTAFTATVFTRSDDPPTKPIGGDYFDPKPTSNDGVTWYDAIPPGTGFPWMSSRIFSSNGLYPQEAEWSTPTYAADSADLDFAFSSNATQPEPPISHGNHSEDPNWYNDGDEHSIWMAVSKMRNNEWGQWKITKIKGEQGPVGESSTIKGYFNSENDLRIAYDKYLAGLITESGFKLPLTVGNGYLVNGYLWIFDGNGESFEDDWINVGSIKGEPGQSQYFYVGYKNNLDDPNEEVMINGRVGKYIGTKLSSIEISPDDLKKLTTYDNWTQWTGDDGWGWEQVFMATSVSTPPHILETEKSLSEAELIDKGWSDKPISVSDTDKYIWYLFRKSTGSWKGESEAEGVIYAALYDRWTDDACTFKLSDHQIIVPVEDDGSVDSDWYSENQSELLNLHLYKGDQEISYSEITFGFESDPVDNDLVEILDGVAHINRRSLNNISKIKFTATYKEVVYEDVCHIITDKRGYELRVNTPILVVNPDSRTVNPATVKASLTKWNGTSFVPVSGKTLLFTVNDMNGGSSTTGHTTDESGWALLTSTYNNVKNIHVQYKGETVTLEQYVDCVTNGPPGDKGEPGKGISGIIKYYCANNSPTTKPATDEDDKWKLNVTEAGLSSDNRYLWCWELISFTDASTKSSVYLIAVEGEPGASGTGKDAPMIYPAGIWRDDITYTSTDSKLPYVYYATNSKYYTLLPNKTAPINTPPTNKSYWDELESYDAIYANIGIFNQALVGSWVFHGDYMFSQIGRGASKANGHISSSVSYSEYESPKDSIITYISRKTECDNKSDGVISEFPWFCPNVVFNAATGQFFLATGQIYNGSDGTLFFGKTSHFVGETLDTILREYIWQKKEDYIFAHSIKNANTLIYASKLFLGSNVTLTPSGTFTLQLKEISDLQQGRSVKVVFLGEGLTKCSKKIQCYTYGREEPIPFLNLPQGYGNADITVASSFGTTYKVPNECTSLDIHFIVDGTNTYAAIC